MVGDQGEDCLDEEEKEEDERGLLKVKDFKENKELREMAKKSYKLGGHLTHGEKRFNI